MGLIFNRKVVDIAPTQEQLTANKSQRILDSLKNSVAFIEFTPQGTIIDANLKFLNTVDYTLDEIKGKHHRIFCDESYTKSSNYEDFWQQLAAGESVSDQFLRFTKQGTPIWLEASYNAVKDVNGHIESVVKIASDITEFVIESNIEKGILSALDRSTAIISFELDGTIIEANENFLAATGYSLSDIAGNHHKMFCPSELVASREYSTFWTQLNHGEFVQGLFERKDNQITYYG